MTDPTKRRRITPTLVQASPTAAADADGLNARKQQLAVPPVVRPADPNAASLSGPGRRIYVDLFAGNEVNWREVRTGRRAVGARVQRQKARKCLAVALPRAKNCFAPPTTVLNCRRPSYQQQLLKARGINYKQLKKLAPGGGAPGGGGMLVRAYGARVALCACMRACLR